MKDKEWYMSFTPMTESTYFFRQWVDTLLTAEPVFMGVDWAKDSGMIRGDVIDRNGNVIYVRFKTVTI